MFSFLKGKSDQSSKVTDLRSKRKGGIKTRLSIPSEWELTEEERYVYSFHNNRSPRLQVNQLSIYGMELMFAEDGGLLATGLIRSTVTKNIEFKEPIRIILLGEENTVLAYKLFDLRTFGVLSPNTARPWTFRFLEDDLQTDLEQIPKKWELVFHLRSKHRLDLEPSWEKAIGDRQRQLLEKVVHEAPPLKNNEINLLGVSLNVQENGDVAATVLIRNGRFEDLVIEKIPISIIDPKTNEEITRASFTLGQFIVKANTSKPWTFIFPKEKIKKDPQQLEIWQAIIVE